MKKREILMPSGAKVLLAEAMGVTRKCVYEALTYKTDSALARKIRYTAQKQFGGLEAKN